MSGPSVHATRLRLNLFSSPEAALLLVSTKDRDLWEGSTSKVRDSRTSRHSAENTNRILWACSKSSLTEIYETNSLRILRKLDLPRGRVSCCSPKGARPLGTRMDWTQASCLNRVLGLRSRTLKKKNAKNVLSQIATNTQVPKVYSKVCLAHVIETRISKIKSIKRRQQSSIRRGFCTCLHRWPKLDIWVALCWPLHCYVTRAICIFIKICMGKEKNPKKNKQLPLNYNKNRSPEFQRRFLCVLCDFLTDLERFSVV